MQKTSNNAFLLVILSVFWVGCGGSGNGVAGKSTGRAVVEGKGICSLEGVPICVELSNVSRGTISSQCDSIKTLPVVQLAPAGTLKMSVTYGSVCPGANDSGEARAGVCSGVYQGLIYQLIAYGKLSPENPTIPDIVKAVCEAPVAEGPSGGLGGVWSSN